MLQLPLQAPLEPMSVDIISLIYVVTDVLCSAVFYCFFMFVHRKTHCRRNNIQILSNPELNELKKMDRHMVLIEIK